MQGFLLKISLRTYAIVFLFLATGFGYYASQRTANTTYQPIVTTVIDHSLKGIQASRFDNQGHLTEVLTMASWQHQQGEMVSNLVEPRLTIYQPEGSWDISALNGKSVQTTIHGKIEALHLMDNVIVKRKSHTDKEAVWELKTQKMVFHPQQSVASTEEPVVIIGQGMQIHAKGMNANLKNHTINLLNDVKSHYALKN